MRFAIIDSVTLQVRNTCEWEGAEWLPPFGTYIVQSDSANIGDEYAPLLNTFTRPGQSLIGEIVDGVGGLLGGGK